MDPMGFRWKTMTRWAHGAPWMSASRSTTAASCPTARICRAVGAAKILLDHRGQFVEAFTSRLMTYALSRGLGPFDQPQVRAIARAADADGDRIQTIIRGIVASDSFRLRGARAKCQQAAHPHPDHHEAA
jgi:hypothetical protein